MMAAARQAAAPRPRAYRGLATSDSAPMTGVEQACAQLPAAARHRRDRVQGRVSRLSSETMTKFGTARAANIAGCAGSTAGWGWSCLAFRLPCGLAGPMPGQQAGGPRAG